MITPEEWAAELYLGQNTTKKYLLTLRRSLRRFEKWFSLRPDELIDEADPALLHNWFEEMAEAEFSVSTRQEEWMVIRKWLGRNGNPAIHTVRPIWPQEERVVDWLDDDELERSWSAACELGPDHRMLLTLTFWGLMRRIEASRFRLSDVLSRSRVRVRGKGRGGPKIRIVALSTHMQDELQLYLQSRRNPLVARARARTQEFRTGHEDRLLLTTYRGELKSPGETTLDNWANEIHKLAETGSGGHHVFRRSAARRLWLDGVPTETIGALLGHADTRTTLRYIGVNVEDQAEALENFDPEKLWKPKGEQ